MSISVDLSWPFDSREENIAHLVLLWVTVKFQLFLRWEQEKMSFNQRSILFGQWVLSFWLILLKHTEIKFWHT